MEIICEIAKARPIAPPIESPKDRLIMKYSPPPLTFRFVAISAIASPVGIVMACPKRMIIRVPHNPRLPTAYPKRKNRIAPRIVLIAAR